MADVKPIDTAHDLPGTLRGRGIRETLAQLSALLARWSLVAAIIVTPFRYQLEILTRPRPPLHSGYTDFLFFVSDAAMTLTLACWLFSLVVKPRKIRFGPEHIWIPLAALTGAGAISAIQSYDAALTLYHSVRLIMLFGFFLFIVNNLPSKEWVIVPAGIQVAIQSVIALAQFLSQGSIGLQQIGELRLNPALTGISVVTANGIRLLRAYGLTDHPNILGGCLAFGIVLLLAACLRGSVHPLALAAFVAAAAALLVSFSRAAWLALLGGGALILAASVRRRRSETMRRLSALALICVVVLGSIVVAYRPFFGVRLNSDQSFSGHSAERQSIGERAILTSMALPILRDHALSGVGLGASPEAFKIYYPEFQLNYEPPHLALLDAALESGVPGGLCYLALLVFPVVSFIKRREELLADDASSTAFALLISIAIVGLFDYYTWLLTAGRIWQWLAWGLWAWAITESRKAPQAVADFITEPARGQDVA